MGAWSFRRRQSEPYGWHPHPYPQRRSPHPGRRNRVHHRRRHDRRLRFGYRHGQGRAVAPFHEQDPLRSLRTGSGAGDAVRDRGRDWARWLNESHRAGQDRRSSRARRARFLGLMAMVAPTVVYDLDGTLADTAEDLVATLNWLLGREGLAPLRAKPLIRKPPRPCSPIILPIIAPISPIAAGSIQASTRRSRPSRARAGGRRSAPTRPKAWPSS